MSSPEKTLGIEQTRLAKAIQIGSVLIDPKNVEETLHRYVKHIFALNDSDQIPYSFPGSGSAIRIANRHLLFCCGHQIELWKPDQIAFNIYNSNTIISSTSMFHPTVNSSNADTDFIDARAFEYQIEKYDCDNLESDFFPANPQRIWPNYSINAPFMVYGYPSSLQDVDYSFPKIASHAVEIKATYDGGTSSPHLHRIKMVRNTQFNSDGMSGGPVFYLGKEKGSYFLGWAGMVMRGSASSEYLHFLAANFLIEMAFQHPIDEIIRLEK